MIIEDAPENLDDLILKVVTKTPDILLSPCTTSQFLVYHSQLKSLGVNVDRSSYIDFFEMSSILSLNRLESRPLFQCFRCFDTNIWALILISILTLSLLSSLRNMSFNNLYENVWNYSISLLGINFQNFMNMSIKNSKVIIYAWLIPAFLLNTNFVSYFFDDMVLPTPIIKIDTIDNLFDSDMRIVARYDSALYTYLESIDSPLINRFEAYDNFPSNDILIDRLIAGSLAYVNHKFLLIFDAMELNAMYKQLKVNDEKDLIDWLHVSKDDGGSEPYFMLINGNMDKLINNDFNFM